MRMGMCRLFAGLRGMADAGVQSELVRILLESGKIVQRMTGIGLKAHGLVHWQDRLLTLDSAHASLMLLHPQGKTVQRLWQVCGITVTALLVALQHSRDALAAT